MMRKISNRIVISYSLLIIALVIFLLLFFTDLIRAIHLDIIKDEMRGKIEFIELILKQRYPLRLPSNESRIREAVRELSQIINLRITLVDADGKVFADSEVGDIAGMDSHRYRAEISDSLSKGMGEAIRYSHTLRTDMLYTAKKYDEWIIRLAKPLYAIDQSEGRIRKLILLLGLIVTSITVVIAFFISKRVTGPVNEAIRFARRFSRGDYSSRILNYSDDEIGTLQKSLNGLADIIVEKMDTLMLEQNKLAITIEHIHDGICVVDSRKTVLIANRAFLESLDIKSECVGRKFFEVIRSSSFNARIEFALIRGEQANFEEELLTGQYCEVFISPIKEERAIQGILIVIHDITEKKRIDRLKTELVGNLSHELKTPIAIQRGYLETIRQYLSDTEPCREFLDKSLANVERQNSIINDMLKLNRIETAPHFAAERIDCSAVIANCVDILSQKAATRHVTITMDLEKIEGAGMIEANRFLAEEVFFNIIDNAISYNTEHGSVNISTESGARDIRVIISDTGVGIPEESIGRIFERFYRVDSSRSRETGGTGLGLSIVKHAAEILGWKIGVTSSGKGTEFTVTIPR